MTTETVLTDFDCSFCPFSKYKGRFNIFKKIDKTPVLKNLGAFFFPLQWFVVVWSRDLVPIHFHFEWKMLQFSNELHFLRKSFFGGKLMMFVLGTRGVTWYLGIWRKGVKVQTSLPRHESGFKTNIRSGLHHLNFHVDRLFTGFLFLLHHLRNEAS